ncbi:ral GTPase-activating protein subunit alpha-1-like isoform X5 [Haliotis asinina]|uniref:ral GTPase-activating protein subunit alpha-1-like isoform X5 n=1 Tax=Haliotis asinina TaxID=109174 RepID=UPI003531CEB7
MTSALFFRKTASHGDIKKSAQKVADPKKDTVTRLKHLRSVLENYDCVEGKKFFQENYSHIYYIFYDNFGVVENDLKQRASKAHREELEAILHIFEKILFFLPELIHKRWMFHSIGRVMKKLLHPANSIKLRREGMRLFIVWYQILQDNASEECHRIFLQLVPDIGDGVHQDILNNKVPQPPDTCSGVIASGEVTAILPGAGEKIPENVTKYFLDALLTVMVSEVIKIEWMNKDMRETSFVFLFNKFKDSYLHWLLPEFEMRDIYEPVLDLPRVRTIPEMMAKDEPVNVTECRDSFIKWLANFTLSTKKPDNNLVKGLSCSALAEGGTDDVPDSSEVKATNMEPIPGSNASTLSGSNFTEKDSANSSQCSDDHSLSEYEIVRTVLYSTRENVNIVHECFRQALLFSFRHAAAMRKVITVYKEWFQHVDQRPIFMQEPCSETGQALDSQRNTPEFHHSSLSDIVEEDISSDDSLSASASSIPRQSFLTDGLEKPKYIRNASYLGAVQDLADQGEQQQLEVRAGMQKVLQVFITNAANIFLLDTDDDSSLQEQVDLCKRVLNIYRHVVMNVQLHQKTWEQILVVLLRVTSGVLQTKPPTERYRTIGGRLAQPIFQTLIVTWIKANLNVLISPELWDEFLGVLSSLTSWMELVKEWAKTMETLTRVLARQVYGLDLLDLPLVRLSEQKEKRRRGRSQDGAKAKAAAEKSFSRGWSRGDGHVNLRGSTNSASSDSNFERAKNKSDGAGGSRPRPDLHKQRSLSGEPSPDHSRSGSTASDNLIVRSSSEGNIADPKELIEKLRAIAQTGTQGAGFTSESSRKSSITACAAPANGGVADPVVSLSGASAAIEDHEVADITATCTAELASVASGFSNFSQENGVSDLSADSISLEKSDSETVVRPSRTPSPVSVRSKSGSRTPSPSVELISDSQHKDSPTPDRDSLHIDMVAGPEDTSLSRDSLNELKSVMAGGAMSGWMPDVAVVLWRRMLGCLGDVNQIQDPVIHEYVFDYLCDLAETLIRMRENLGVTQDNTSSPPPPELIPPHHIFATWLFECLTLNNKYKKGKLLAYQLICQMLVRHHDVTPSQEILSHFYYVLHHGLVAVDQDVINVLVRNSGPKYFSLPLPGNLLLMMDFVHAAGTIISAVDVKAPPRSEAVSVLGALLCFPNHFLELPVLKPNSVDISVLKCNEMKDTVVNLLLKAGKREPAGLARCIAVSSVGIYLYEELTHGTQHSKVKEGVQVLLTALKECEKPHVSKGYHQKNDVNSKCGYRKVAKVGSDMLLLLCDHCEVLLTHYPSLPRTIVEFIAQTISSLLQAQETSSVEEEKRLIVAMMFCMVEWCLKIPMQLLMETTDSERSCIYKVFRVLHSAVTGHSAASLSRTSKSLADFIQDLDTDNIVDSQSTSSGGSPKMTYDGPTEPVTDQPKTTDAPRKPETDIVKLAARTMMTHLVNHLNHFPMGSGAARLNSNVQEHHDIPNYVDEELKPDIFSAPNVQFFVVNHRALISFVELPAVDAPGGGVTAGLSTARTVCRVVIRDLSGKYCWESSVLYSPPWCKKGSSLHNAQTLLTMTTDMELEPLIIQEDSDIHVPEVRPRRPPTDLPHAEDMGRTENCLDDLLRYIGHTSPECLLRLGNALNISAPIPEDLGEQAETMMTDMVLQQKIAELEYYNKHKSDMRQLESGHMLAKPQLPADIQDPVSPFQMCRLVLNQMGLLSWEKRCHFDLMKKSDKLLRELKNLDNQMCRETHKIAVIYVAEGQEDKISILSNSSASKAFEEFVAGLGWEVDLETHQGFRGGLQANKTTGDTAPYYANSTCEVVFHVSTRIPSGTDESRHIKMRHLGNDEVHIIWSEHVREYRRGIIPTEFGDVIIVIYPLPNGLYRIQINRKQEVGYFGPLFDGAIVDHLVLPGLVRATAINASRVKRSQLPFFHSFYEERAKCLETIIQQHTEHSTFEDFAAHVFAPVLPNNGTILDNQIPSETSNTSLTELTSPEPSVPVGQVSPTGMKHSRGSESGTDMDETDSKMVRSSRRWSMRNRKSSASKSSTPNPTIFTPPGSPKSKNKK